MSKKARLHPGEIRVAASSNGKEITLDSIRDLVLRVPAKQIESSILCGLRVEWISGSYGNKKIELLVGAGCGSKWMIFQCNGKEYVVDVGDIARAFMKAINGKKGEKCQR